MAVLGASPALSYAPVLSQAFSGNASQTIFTLNSSVGATTDLTVVVDNVHQSPYDGSYSVAGTTLTFSEAPATGTNNIYVMYGIVRAGAVTKQVIPDDGSVTTAKLNGNLVTPGNLSVTGTVEVLGGAGGASVTVKNGGDLLLQNATNTFSANLYCDVDSLLTTYGYGLKATNRPAFRAKAQAGRNETGTGWAKVIYDNNVYQTGFINYFDSSQSRFTAPVTGWYQFNAQWNADNNGDSDGTFSLALNGSVASNFGTTSMSNTGGSYDGHCVSACTYLAVGDYVELFRYSTVATVYRGNDWQGWFSGFYVG